MNGLSLVIRLSESRFLSIYIVIIHLLLIFTVSFYPVTGMVGFLIIGIIIAHGIYSQWRHSHLSVGNWVNRLTYNHQQWTITLADEPVLVRLKQATVWNRLVVLVFESDNPHRDYPVLVFSDSTDVENHRQLRVILKHMPVFASD